MSRSRCGPSSTDASVVLDAVLRDQWGRVLATLVGILGDIELAEDAAAEAFAIAAERWPRDGEPANPICHPGSAGYRARSVWPDSTMVMWCGGAFYISRPMAAAAARMLT